MVNICEIAQKVMKFMSNAINCLSLFNSFIYFLDISAEDIQCFTVKPILDLPAKFQNKPVSEQIVR